MYERLPLDFIGLTDKFGTRNDPITGVSTFHYGIDMGWHSYQGEPVYAIYDSTVALEGYDDTLGNYIVFTYQKNNKTIIYRYFHLKNRAIVKKGDKVTRKQIVGYMGTTGYSNGTHLHFEYWICPLNYTYNTSDRTKYAVNPLNYCYLFDDQTVSSSSNSYVIRVVGSNIKLVRDIGKNQIEVIGTNLRCRETPSLNGNIQGYIDYGIYNILTTKEQDNYTWYQIDNNKWIAGVKGDVKVYNSSANGMDSLKNKISELELEIVALKNNCLKDYCSFKALNSGRYYISLKEGETIYFPK